MKGPFDLKYKTTSLCFIRHHYFIFPCCFISLTISSLAFSNSLGPSSNVPIRYEPESYGDLLKLKEYRECQEVFLCARWGPFLHLLQGHYNDISLQFSISFDGKLAHIGPLSLLVTEDSIAFATTLPRTEAHWHKHHFFPCSTFEFAFKPTYQEVAGRKGFHREWIKDKYISPLVIII